METVINQLFQDHHIHQSRNWKLLRPPHPPNQLFQDHHILQIWKLLQISYFKTTTSSKYGNCYKSVISRPPHPPNMETVTNQLFQDHHILQIWKLLQISYFKTTNTSKIETVKNHFFQDNHILQIWKLLQISYFKTVTILNHLQSTYRQPPYNMERTTSKSQLKIQFIDTP